MANGLDTIFQIGKGGISEETEITICVDSGHKTAENLMTPQAAVMAWGVPSAL